jgi:hypothetical protein
MKYYCEKQDVTVEVNKNLTKLGHQCLGACYSCSNMAKIPAHETVAQWEARKGRKYPDTAPVYQNLPDDGCWTLDMYVNAFQAGYSIVATEAGAPPRNWSPE